MNPAAKPLSSLVWEYIGQHGLLKEGDHVLAAVSGGPDSVALLGVLTDLRDVLSLRRITVIHFDHGLRGEESEADREFVESLAHCGGLDFRWAHEDVGGFARKRKISLEMAARERRRCFFFKSAAELKADKIALGHTADDQAEEVFLRILRGAGPAGVQAMSPATDNGIIRPLLFATRAAILEYLAEKGMEFRNDSTNFVPSCQRNILRLQVFPLLKEAFNPQISLTIARCADLAREEESWWKTQIEEVWKTVCLESGAGRVSLDLDRLRGLHRAVRRRILRFGIGAVRGDLYGVGFVHLEAVMGLVRSGKEGKRVEIPGGIEAEVRGGKLYISSTRCIALEEQLCEPLAVRVPGSYVLGGFHFELRFIEAGGALRPGWDTDCVQMDRKKLKGPLRFRFRRAGDRFYPLGMRGSKKLQDFFTDCGVPRRERQGIPLLCDSEKICWIAGMRMDDRVKIDSKTQEILLVRFARS